MGRNEIVERLKTQRDSARMKLRDAQGEASGIIAAANSGALSGSLASKNKSEHYLVNEREIKIKHSFRQGA
jgi:hypothetical protein